MRAHDNVCAAAFAKISESSVASFPRKGARSCIKSLYNADVNAIRVSARKCMHGAASSRRQAPARCRLKRIPGEKTHHAAAGFTSPNHHSRGLSCGKIKRKVARKFRKLPLLLQYTNALPCSLEKFKRRLEQYDFIFFLPLILQMRI